MSPLSHITRQRQCIALSLAIIGILLLRVVTADEVRNEADPTPSPEGGTAPTTTVVKERPASLYADAPYITDLTNVQLAALHNHAAVCPWVVMLYHDSCGHCRTIVPNYTAFAKTVWDAANEDTEHPGMRSLSVGALNCAQDINVCFEQSMKEVPTVYMYLPRFLTTSAAGEESAKLPVLSYMERIRVNENDEDLVNLVRKVEDTWTTYKEQLPWGPANDEACADLRHHLQLTKQDSIEKAAAGTASGPAVPFHEYTDVSPNDVANAFFYTLYHEVALGGLDTPERRKAAEAFVTAVHQSMPGLGAGLVLLFLRRNPDAGVNVTQWQELVLSAGIPFRGTPRKLQWKTCRGSSWRYRGFPCGLWLLYHSLTVNYPPPSGGASDRGAILFIILEYARNFFTCETCRRHFMRSKFARGKDPVMQLWHTHNVVNHFLANVTEGADPLVPKRQFPSSKQCPACVNADGSFAESKVASYLRQRYLWNPQELHVTTITPTSDVLTPEDEDQGGEVITVRRDPLGLNIFLTLGALVLCVGTGCRFVLRTYSPRRRKTGGGGVAGNGFYHSDRRRSGFP